MIEWDRLQEVALVAVVAFAATVARVCFGVVAASNYPPKDPELARLWLMKMRWAIAGEVAATLVFILCAEAFVMVRGLSGPTGVLIGAAAAVLGFPFLSGILRKRVASRLEMESDA